MAGQVAVYNAGGLILENNAPNADVGTVRSLLEGLQVPDNIALVIGEGSGVSPDTIVGLLTKGWFVVQWTGFPFFAMTGSYPLRTAYHAIGTSPFATVMNQWTEPASPPPRESFKWGVIWPMGPGISIP